MPCSRRLCGKAAAKCASGPSSQDSRRGVRYREAAAGTGTGGSGARRFALTGAVVVGFSRRAVASPPPIEQRPSSSAPSCTTRLAVVTLPRTRPDARSSSRSRAVTSPVTPPSMTIDVPEIFAFTTAPSPTVSASCAEISPSTWPSIRAVPSSTSLPLTLVPLPRNVSIPPGPASWLVFRSRSNIATSPGAIPSTGMTGTGTARGTPPSRSRPNSAMSALGQQVRGRPAPERRPRRVVPDIREVPRAWRPRDTGEQKRAPGLAPGDRRRGVPRPKESYTAQPPHADLRDPEPRRPSWALGDERPRHAAVLPGLLAPGAAVTAGSPGSHLAKNSRSPVTREGDLLGDRAILDPVGSERSAPQHVPYQSYSAAVSFVVTCVQCAEGGLHADLLGDEEECALRASWPSTRRRCSPS